VAVVGVQINQTPVHQVGQAVVALLTVVAELELLGKETKEGLELVKEIYRVAVAEGLVPQDKQVMLAVKVVMEHNG
jgi:hypothetical protein